jgi:hypothetical protein
MVVTHVSRHWLTIALSTPTLWKNLDAKHITASLGLGWNY